MVQLAQSFGNLELQFNISRAISTKKLLFMRSHLKGISSAPPQMIIISNLISITIINNHLIRNRNQMENSEKMTNTTYKRPNVAYIPFESIENLAKKRPSSTKLDLEKMYEESLELTAHYKQLVQQNQQLKQEYQRVESIKLNRQNLISTVQKIVEEKSKELNGKQSNNFSWLVFKLNNKIYDLKGKIQAKEKAITELTLSRESQAIRQKETQIECLNQIVEFAKNQGLYQASLQNKEGFEVSDIKEIVWMEQEVKQKESEIIQAERIYQQEEKEVRKLMKQLAQKKAELKSIKEMENQYNKAQEIYKEEKRKKEQRIAGNKTYLEELQIQKAEQLKKLQTLKSRYTSMEQEENSQIQNLKTELQTLKKQYEERIKSRQQTVIKFSEDKTPTRSKKQVKRVTYDQVKVIGSNLNYTLALKGISHTELGTFFTAQNKQQLSIRQVFQKLKKYPFQMQRDEEALLVARYTVEDSGDGYFLEDMDTTQSVSIIKSILAKIIGEVKIFEKDRAEQLRQLIGPILFKFGRLVQQCLDLKQGTIRETNPSKKQLVTKEKMVDALQNTLSSLQNESFLHEQIDFTIFYLFSWSRHLNQLEVNRMFTMKDEKIVWPQRQ